MEMSNPLLRRVLILIIVICLLMIITSGVSPYPLAILGMAIICLSLMPKTPKGRDND